MKDYDAGVLIFLLGFLAGAIIFGVIIGSGALKEGGQIGKCKSQCDSEEIEIRDNKCFCLKGPE